MSLLSYLCFWTFSNVYAQSPETKALESQFPQEYQHRNTISPIATRAGHLRFVGSELADPMWAPLYIERYLSKKESPAVRRALLDLIFRSQQALPQEIIDTYAQEPDILRAEIVDLIPFGSIRTEDLLQDESALVRASLLRKVAKTPTASTEIILRGLQDTDPHVLADAARAAHQRECTEAITLLSQLITHQDGTVALRSLYALSKLDAERAKDLVQKHKLYNSNHTNLALFAHNLLAK